MKATPVLENVINEARNEIQPDNAYGRIFSDEQAVLQRLVNAIDTESDTELTATVLQIKARLKAVRCSVLTVLPALVLMLADELQRQA